VRPPANEKGINQLVHGTTNSSIAKVGEVDSTLFVPRQQFDNKETFSMLATTTADRRYKREGRESMSSNGTNGIIPRRSVKILNVGSLNFRPQQRPVGDY
jgi:hypothetical protein